jgi:hypothetical protein
MCAWNSSTKHGEPKKRFGGSGSRITLSSKKHANLLKSDIKIEMAMGLAKTAADRSLAKLD